MIELKEVLYILDYDKIELVVSKNNIVVLEWNEYLKKDILELK